MTAVSENDKIYPTTVTQQINFTDGDVFNSRADICWLIYGKFRDRALDAILRFEPAYGSWKCFGNRIQKQQSIFNALFQLNISLLLTNHVSIEGKFTIFFIFGWRLKNTTSNWHFCTTTTNIITNITNTQYMHMNIRISYICPL